MAHQFSLRRRVEFADTDMAGIMHFSNFFRFMEATEVAFYRSLGFSIISAEHGVGWPRVHAECDFARPLRFEDDVEIRLLVQEKRTRSVNYWFKMMKQEGQETIVAARGAVTVVCVRKNPEGGMASCALPEFFVRAVDQAPPDVISGW